jgi:hypothetical protein
MRAKAAVQNSDTVSETGFESVDELRSESDFRDDD